MITGIQDKAIKTKFVIKTLDMAGQSFNLCLAKCLEDCLCKSFQVCDTSTCELSSIEKDEDTSAFHTRLGCVYYNLDALNVSDRHACSFVKNADMDIWFWVLAKNVYTKVTLSIQQYNSLNTSQSNNKALKPCILLMVGWWRR